MRHRVALSRKCVAWHYVEVNVFCQCLCARAASAYLEIQQLHLNASLSDGPGAVAFFLSILRQKCMNFLFVHWKRASARQLRSAEGSNRRPRNVDRVTCFDIGFFPGIARNSRGWRRRASAKWLLLQNVAISLSGEGVKMVHFLGTDPGFCFI